MRFQFLYEIIKSITLDDLERPLRTLLYIMHVFFSEPTAHIYRQQKRTVQ